MPFRWFDTSKVRAFAAEVAHEYARLRKSVELRQDSKDKRRERHAKLFEKIRRFERDEKPNVYQRAAFLQALRTELTGAGVDTSEAAEFVSSITVSPLA